MSEPERRKQNLIEQLTKLEDNYKSDPSKHGAALAEAYVDQGRPTDAVKLLEKNGLPQSVDVKLLFVRALFDSFQNEEAIGMLKELTQKEDLSDHPEAQLLLGEMAFEEGKPDEAKSYLRTAYQLRPDSAKVIKLLKALGEKIDAPDTSVGSDNEVREFNIDDSQTDSAGRAGLHIFLGLLIFGVAFGGYILSARKSHEAKTLAAEALPMLERGDIKTMLEAEEKYNEVFKIDSTNDYGVAGMAYLNSFLWAVHGLETAKDKALDYTNRAIEQDILSAERYAAEALAAVASGDQKKAQSIVKAVAEKGGVSDKLYFALGLSLEAEGKVRAARDNFRKAHELKLKSPHYATALADVYNAEGDGRNARLFWARAAKANSSYVIGSSRNLWGKVQRGQPTGPIEKELKRYLNFPEALVGPFDKSALLTTQAALALREGKKDIAIQKLDAAIAIKGEIARLLHLKGLALLASGKKEEGFSLLQKANTKLPSSFKYLEALIVNYTEYDEADKAIEILRAKEKDLKDEPEFHVLMGNAYRVKQDYPKADIAFDNALKISKKYPYALLGKAVVLKDQNKYEDAIKWFEKAAGAKAKFPEIYENIGIMFVLLGDKTGGDKQLEESEKQLTALGTGKLDMAKFYSRVVTAVGAKSWTLKVKWEGKLKALEAAPTKTAAQ
ncbi:MAG: tetratricopeptide repeat protein [Myxococcota bacterium]|nr:tetratricopeptide repeat protein [Myxococcota bacterium]